MGFLYDVFQTTVLHRFPQSSSTTKNEMFDKTVTFNCLSFLFKLNAIIMHQSNGEIGKVMEILSTSVFTIFRSLYESLDMQRRFVQERH